MLSTTSILQRQPPMNSNASATFPGPPPPQQDRRDFRSRPHQTAEAHHPVRAGFPALLLLFCDPPRVFPRSTANITSSCSHPRRRVHRLRREGSPHFPLLSQAGILANNFALQAFQTALLVEGDAFTIAPVFLLLFSLPVCFFSRLSLSNLSIQRAPADPKMRPTTATPSRDSFAGETAGKQPRPQGPVISEQQPNTLKRPYSASLFLLLPCHHHLCPDIHWIFAVAQTASSRTLPSPSPLPRNRAGFPSNFS